MEGVVTGDIFIAEGATGAMADFINAHREKYNVEPNKVGLVVYEAVKVVAEAMDKAGTDSDYDLIAKTIRDNVWTTPRGELTFDEKGRSKAPFFYIHTVKGDNVALRETFEVK